jgi:hypothetical protein
MLLNSHGKTLADIGLNLQKKGTFNSDGIGYVCRLACVKMG